MWRLEESTTVHDADEVVSNGKMSVIGVTSPAPLCPLVPGRGRPRGAAAPCRSGYAPGQGPGVGATAFSSVSSLKTLKPRRR